MKKYFIHNKKYKQKEIMLNEMHKINLKSMY